MTVFIIVLLGLSLAAHDPASHHVKTISVVGADLPAGRLRRLGRALPALRRRRRGGPRVASEPAPTPRRDRGEPQRAARLALGLIARAAGRRAAPPRRSSRTGSSTALQPAIEQLHISQAFAGLVIVAIAGNAVENTRRLVLAWKGRSDLAISVVKNSVAQIAAFLFPALVLISFALSTTLTFALAPVYIGALALTALALWQVTGDGEAAAFEGWALVALYVILATSRSTSSVEKQRRTARRPLGAGAGRRAPACASALDWSRPRAWAGFFFARARIAKPFTQGSTHGSRRRPDRYHARMRGVQAPQLPNE